MHTGPTEILVAQKSKFVFDFFVFEVVHNNLRDLLVNFCKPKTIPLHEKHNIKAHFSFILYCYETKISLPLIARERLTPFNRAWKIIDFNILYHMHLLSTLALNPPSNSVFQLLHSSTCDG